MKTNEREKIISHIKEVAKSLGCKFDEIKTLEKFNETRSLCHYVQVKDGVYLEISYHLNSNSVIRIGFFHPKYKNFNGVFRINCNMKKSHSRIVSDVRSRLLFHFDSAKESLEKVKAELIKEKEKLVIREQCLNAVKMVSNSKWQQDGINKYFLHKDVEIESERMRERLKSSTVKVHVATVFQKYERNETFDLDLKNLNPTQVIQVMSLLGI
ncbi:hypothetical protein ACTTZI_004154 [Vibrio vulnificus]